jgi:membrane-associated protein
MTDWLQQIFTTATDVMPIEILVFIASFIEEVIPPIPAFPLTILAGSVANVQEYTLLGLLFVAIVGAIGKTIGAVIIYFATIKVETVVIKKYGKYLKITEEDLTRFGKKLGHGKLDYLVLILLRAIPIFPSVLTTVGSAIIHVPLPLYIISTLIGSIIRYSIYLYAGYVSADILIIAIAKLEESPISLVILIISVVALLVWLLRLYKTRSQSN